jgi:hypothetical protein
LNKKVVLGGIAGGIVLTLLTGFVEAPSLIGATNYGYPFVWLTQYIIAPEYFPWQFHPVRFTLDVIVWAIIVALVLYVFLRKKK